MKREPARRCIVYRCANCSDHGTFVGDMCAPCWEYITKRIGINSQAFRNAMVSARWALDHTGRVLPHLEVQK